MEIFHVSMTEQLSGVVQVPCRYPAGALAGVKIGAEISLLSLGLSIITKCSSCTRGPHREGNSINGSPYITGSETNEGVTKNQAFAQTENQNPYQLLKLSTLLLHSSDRNRKGFLIVYSTGKS